MPTPNCMIHASPLYLVTLPIYGHSDPPYNGVGMALNEATLPLILYRKVKTIEHVIVKTLCHISIPCFITFSASAIPTPFLIFNVLVL